MSRCHEVQFNLSIFIGIDFAASKQLNSERIFKRRLIAMNGIYDLWDNLSQRSSNSADTSGIFSFYRRFGFDICNIAVTNRHSGTLHGFVTNMSTAWMDHYYERQFGAVDPILDLALTTQAPTVFDATAPLQGSDRGVALANEMLDGFRGEGGNASFVIPMFCSPTDRQVVMGLASHLKAGELKRMLSNNTREILVGSALVQSILATESLEQFADSHYRHNPIETPALTPREREVLKWLAAGLRTDRIASRMNVANVTVNYHLMSVKRKLGAKTREQALAIAIAGGMIEV